MSYNQWPLTISGRPQKKTRYNIGFNMCGVVCPLCNGRLRRVKNVSMMTGASTEITSLACSAPGFTHHSVQVDKWSRPITIGFTLKFIVGVMCLQEGVTKIHMMNGKLDRVVDHIMSLPDLKKLDRAWIMY